MAADPDLVAAFIKHLEGMIAANDKEIAALEAGKKIQECGPETGFKWVDITASMIQRLKDSNTGLRHTIERVWKNYA
jgi:hypothetical protein